MIIDQCSHDIDVNSVPSAMNDGLDLDSYYESFWGSSSLESCGI